MSQSDSQLSSQQTEDKVEFNRLLKEIENSIKDLKALGNQIGKEWFKDF
jgi:hypothetical protein